jgi:AcrR family transcriptional regulator
MYYLSPNNAMSLRKEKAARLKLNVLESTLKLIGKKSFDDLYVEDICDRVKISKVTLFKYFPQKEDILMYYLRIWCFHRGVELHDKPRVGMQGIQFLFDKLSESYESHPGIVLRFVAYLADPKRSSKPFPVKIEEKKLLYEDRDEVNVVEINSIEKMIEKFTVEAIAKKEISKSSGARDTAQMLISILYGSIINAHLSQMKSAKNLFRRNIDLAVKGLK